MPQMVGAVVEYDDEEGHNLSTRMNMTQLAFIKRLESVERVMTNEVHNPFLMEEAEHSATVVETTVEVEKGVRGCICCPGSEQWFQFTVPKQGEYTIYTTGSLDTEGVLYDCCGAEKTTNDDINGNLNFRIRWYFYPGQVYYVKVKLNNNDTGNYGLLVTDRILVDSAAIQIYDGEDVIILEKGVTYELPRGDEDYYALLVIEGTTPANFGVELSPGTAHDQRVYWFESGNDVISTEWHWYNNNIKYQTLTAKETGGARLYVRDWRENGTVSECTVIVVAPYCGGDNYRDVTQHSMALQSDGYYVCSKCGYRIKSPALQDKDILSEEDYYTVVSCYTAIPYYSKIDREDEGNYSIQTTALRLIIDNIRCQSQYAQKYEYVGNDGTYKREYTVGNENDDYYMPVITDYNIIDNGLELVLNNGVVSGIVELIIGWKIPTQYQFLFFDLTDGYSNLTDFLCGLAEKVGYKEISFLLKLILFGASADDEMAITDKVVKIQFLVGAAIYETKTVFDSSGNFKSQTHSVF